MLNKCKIKNCSRIQETLLLYKIFMCKKPEDTFTVDFMQKIEPGKCMFYWYGGDVASISYKGCKFVVSARGDVKAALTDKRIGSHIAYVKDRGNGGHFFDEMNCYIKNDSELKLCLDGKNKNYTLEVYENNWWELFFYDRQNNYFDLMLALDSDKIFDAVIEAVESMDKLVAYFEDNGESRQAKECVI